MISSVEPASVHDVATHYDDLDDFYRTIWGDHVHHGLWTDGSETPEQAVQALIVEIARSIEIHAGQHLIDIGCGYGATARYLAARYGVRVQGYTVSQKQADYATATNRREALDDQVHIVGGDWLQNDLPAACCDGAIAIESLSHMPDIPGALREAHRVIRPGGRLAACVWLSADRPSKMAVRHLLEPICLEGRLPGLPTEIDLRTWLQAAGFSTPSCRDLTYQVRRTWTICGRRVLSGLVRRSDYRQYILNPANKNRVFARTVARIWMAYRTGAMRYALITTTKRA